MASVLTSEKADVERIALLIEECKKMEIEVLAPNINESLKNFTVVPDKSQIRFGLLAIKNVGENIIDAVTQERKMAEISNQLVTLSTGCSQKTLIKNLWSRLLRLGPLMPLPSATSCLDQPRKVT
jgi:DNA polymerase-3 subunit alpha